MELREQVPLAPLTTFGIGGPTRYYVHARSQQDIADAIACASARSLPLFVLGGGSNIVVPDEGLHALVLQPAITGITYEELSPNVVRVIAGAGEQWDTLVEQTIANNLAGLENLSWIPGTVGATPVQNVGAYGAEVAQSIESVYAIDRFTGETVEFSNAACTFGYRTSRFKVDETDRYIITAVSYILVRNGAPNISYKDLARAFADTPYPSLQAVREQVISVRTQKFPQDATLGTAGSFFKNPIIAHEHLRALREQYPDMPAYTQSDSTAKVPLAWILEHVTAWKGVRRGAVGVSADHALVLINYGGATALQLQRFAAALQADVYERTGIAIEPEVTLLDRDGHRLPLEQCA
jgi:UDP-N-acetylmuramate dehydrogenase